MIKKVGTGIYLFMPLGLRVMKKIENIIRDEMNQAGASELLMPSLIPEDYYIQSGRKEVFGHDMFSLKDRYDRGYVLGPTHDYCCPEVNTGILSLRLWIFFVILEAVLSCVFISLLNLTVASLHAYLIRLHGTVTISLK